MYSIVMGLYLGAPFASLRHGRRSVARAWGSNVCKAWEMMSWVQQVSSDRRAESFLYLVSVRTACIFAFDVEWGSLTDTVEKSHLAKNRDLINKNSQTNVIIKECQQKEIVEDIQSAYVGWTCLTFCGDGSHAGMFTLWFGGGETGLK